LIDGDVRFAVDKSQKRKSAALWPVALITLLTMPLFEEERSNSQTALRLLTHHGSTATEGRFAPVDVLSYASTIAPNVYVIGDSSATTQPKAGHIANQEAKVCADALARLFAGQQPDPSPVTNSACYSTITRTEAGWLNAVFQYDPAAKAMAPVAKSFAASVGWSSENFKEMGKWFDALMADSFA
jgi:hypothetical protein